MRLNFLYSATETGLLKSLETPTSKQELLEKLAVRRPPLLDRFLALGVALKELSEENGRYRLAGKRSLEISGDNGETFAAWIQFFVNHVGSIHRDLAPRLAGEPLDDLLSSSGALVSRASRIWEPYVGRFMRTLTSTHRPLRILDVGCGSGTYLRYAAANPQSTGIGIELRDDVAEEASMNLSRWGIDDRFSVVTADIRDPKMNLGGPFDLIMLFNNVYYFPVEERPALYRTVRSLLAENGCLAIVSMMKGGSMGSANLDLILASSVGGGSLPPSEEVIQQLRDCGFDQVKQRRLLLQEPLWGIVAT